MAAKTLKQAISHAFEKWEDTSLFGVNQLKLRQDIVNEVRDYMAQQFSTYSMQAEQFQADPEKAELIAETCVDLFDRIFSSVPAINTEKDKK